MFKFMLLLIFGLIESGSIETLNFGTIDMDTIWSSKPVYISFWATYCTSCVRELDEINRIKDSLGIFVIAVCEDGSRKESKVISFIKGKKWSFPVLMDDRQSVMKQYGVTALPSSFLYNKERKLLKRFTGFSPRDVDLIKRLLEGGNEP